MGFPHHRSSPFPFPFLSFHRIIIIVTIRHNQSTHPNYCPYATCHNSPKCHPCHRRFLIILATGRSGSTTITDMLNLLPGVRLAGENDGHLRYGFGALEHLRDKRDFVLDSRESVIGAWRHHPIPEQSLVCPIQDMFESINPPIRRILEKQRFGSRSSGYDDDEVRLEDEEIIGFKTVRFHSTEDFGETPDRSVEFLKETFSCAKFVINLRRDIDAQVRSWKKAFGTDLDGETIRSYNRRLEEVAALLGKDRARVIDMDEWSVKKKKKKKKDGISVEGNNNDGDEGGVKVLNDLVQWLGFEGCRFPELWHANKNGYDLVDKKREFLGSEYRRLGI